MTGFEGQPQGQVQAQCSAQGHTPVELQSLSPPNLPIRTPSLERRIAEILRHKGDQVNEDVSILVNRTVNRRQNMLLFSGKMTIIVQTNF